MGVCLSKDSCCEDTNLQTGEIIVEVPSEVEVENKYQNKYQYENEIISQDTSSKNINIINTKKGYNNSSNGDDGCRMLVHIDNERNTFSSSSDTLYRKLLSMEDVQSTNDDERAAAKANVKEAVIHWWTILKEQGAALTIILDNIYYPAQFYLAKNKKHFVVTYAGGKITQSMSDLWFVSSDRWDIIKEHPNIDQSCQCRCLLLKGTKHHFTFLFKNETEATTFSSCFKITWRMLSNEETRTSEGNNIPITDT
eukprot:GHVR01163855.1.p1 GENE.GHVR01163855.1~~GHVR01163855.1.p1  ORF type:complete len:253 (+),score=58.51 GHVR01163855.1:160-918(+)